MMEMMACRDTQSRAGFKVGRVQNLRLFSDEYLKLFKSLH